MAVRANDMPDPDSSDNTLLSQTIQSTSDGIDDDAVKAFQEQQAAENKLIGEVIDNQYRIVSVLGKGGMSVVYDALYMVLNKHVAIKMMHSHLVSDTNSLLRFRQEAQASSHLDHPNVITVYGFGITQGADPQPYIVMDMIKGKAFSDLISENPTGLPVASVLPIFIQTCSAIGHAHSKGVIHRDLKPSNIMLIEKDGNPHFVKIVDFGIAKVLPQDGEQAHRLTQTGDVFGSPTYMSPEQCTGRPVDKRSDIYALGCVLYEALTGQPPFVSANVFETFHKHIQEIPQPLVMPGVSPAIVERFDAIVFKALRKEPEKRYQTMAELESDLLTIQRDISEGKTANNLTVNISKQKRSLERLALSTPRYVQILLLLILPLVMVGSWLLWSSVHWFYEEHLIAVPGVSWVSYLSEPQAKRKLTAEQARKELDSGSYILKARELAYGDASLEMLKLWQSRAKFCRELGSQIDEIEARNKVIQIMRELKSTSDIEYATACEEYASVLMDQGDWAEAEEFLSTAAELREKLSMSSPTTYIHLGYCQMQRGKLGSAKHSFEEASESLKGTDTNAIALAICQASIGDTFRLAAGPKHMDRLTEADKYYSYANETLSKSDSLKAKRIKERVELYRAFVNEVLSQHSNASLHYASAMPAVERLYASHPAELQLILNNYAVALWNNHEYLKAIEIRGRAASLGNFSMPK